MPNTSRTRERCGDRIVEIAQAGDRVVVMGARDDTLTVFARRAAGAGVSTYDLT